MTSGPVLNGRALVLRDDIKRAAMLERALSKPDDSAAPIVQWASKAIVFSEPDDVVEEFQKLVGGDTPEWMEFDVLLLDVHWGKDDPMGGFTIYDTLKRYFDNEIKKGVRRRLPWRMAPLVSTLYAGNADNDPSLAEVYKRATSMSIPRDQVMQMVLFDDAVKIAHKASQMLRRNPPQW